MSLGLRKHTPFRMIILIVYMDDIIVLGNDANESEYFKAELKHIF